MYINTLLLLVYLIPGSFCDDDIEGQISYYISHSLEPSSSVPIYEPRGIITYNSNKNEAIYVEDGPVSSSEIEKLKELVSTDDFYRVKINFKLGSDDDSVFSFTKACAVYESGLTDALTVMIDQTGLPIGIAISALPPHCIGAPVIDAKLLNFNTTVTVVSVVNGPSPDTLTYIQRLEQEKAEKARGEQGDNRSFLSKYWMYIVPFVIFLFISGASNPEQSGGR